jgi:hypothetical protein
MNHFDEMHYQQHNEMVSIVSSCRTPAVSDKAARHTLVSVKLLLNSYCFPSKLSIRELQIERYPETMRFIALGRGVSQYVVRCRLPTDIVIFVGSSYNVTV